jgi:hypothetical protein
MQKSNGYLVALAIVTFTAAIFNSSPALAQPGLHAANGSLPKFEELHLKPGVQRPGGKNGPLILHGLIGDETPHSVEFMEIRQPPGRHMYMVMNWQYPLDEVEGLVHLDPPDRERLKQWIDDFKNREQIFGEAADKIDLQLAKLNDIPAWHYESTAWRLGPDAGAPPWLIVDSTAEKETTQRSIVRIEQVFAAYREILPPRTTPKRPLNVKLFGAMQQYQSFLNKAGLHIDNPALFVPSQNLLIAGSELSAYAQQLEDVRQRHDALEKEAVELTRQMKAKLSQFQKDLASGGFSPKEQRELLNSAQANWDKQHQELKDQIRSFERHNMAQYDQVTRRMFVRLFHEAFHAYLENYVYPSADHDVPRWLNEGLAQVFEGGQLEAGTLRLDAPDPLRLKALQADLRGGDRLSLAELLSADASQFLVFHSNDANASARHYLYAWGLAYYLTFRQPVLETAALDRYVERSAAAESPTARFENLVGQPLKEFESRWREAMLKMRTDGR